MIIVAVGRSGAAEAEATGWSEAGGADMPPASVGGSGAAEAEAWNEAGGAGATKFVPCG